MPERGHRANIFKENFTEFGVCNGPHKDLGTMAVAIYMGMTTAKIDPKADKVVQEGQKAEQVTEQGEQYASDEKQDGQVEDIGKIVELAKTEQVHRHSPEDEHKKSIEEIIVDTSKVPDFDYRKRHLRERLETAPRTVTHKITKVWGDTWDEKSEKWTREMPEKFVAEPDK